VINNIQVPFNSNSLSILDKFFKRKKENEILSLGCKHEIAFHRIIISIVIVYFLQKLVKIYIYIWCRIYNLKLKHSNIQCILYETNINHNLHIIIRNVVYIHIITSYLYLVRKDMDLNEHERLSNITLRYKLK
jgi:hypothetical protein